MEEWIFQKFGIDYIHGKADRKTLCTRKCGGLGEGLQGGDEWEGRMIPQELEDTSHFQLD